jgi:hypothetical protein
MTFEYEILLSQLKMQPRHGMPYNTGSGVISDIDNQINTFLNQLSTLENSAAEVFSDITKNWKAMADAFVGGSTQVQMGLNALMTSFNAVQSAGITMAKQATFLEQRNKGLVSSFKVSAKEAGVLGNSYDRLSATLHTGGENVREMATRIDKNLLPGMSRMITATSTQNKFSEKFQKDLFMTNNLLVDHMKLSGEQAATYQTMAAAAGQSGLEMLASTSDFADAFEKATGLTGQFGNMLEGVASLTEDIQMHYRKIPGSLQLAVVKAKMLGLEFSKIDAAAEKMLNIEESVNAELNYQLLTGKRIVDQDGKSITEKLRMAKLTGDANAATEAMNELLNSQSDILDGNNFYAKQQLAELTGFSLQELTRANNMKKLMDQTGMGKEKFEEILEMDPAQFNSAISTFSKDQQTMFEQLRQTKSLKSTDELMNDLVEGRRTLKVVNVSPDQAKDIEEARLKMIGAGATGGQGSNAVANAASFGVNPAMAQNVGLGQAVGGASNAVLAGANELIKLTPGLATAMGGYVNSLTAAVGKFSGYSNKVNAGETKDGVIVNDGIIKFHPADKFAAVPDGAALLASTGTGQLASAVDTLTGGGKTAVVDPRPIAAAVASAIQSAMAGMKIQMDGYNLAKAMEFSNRTLNG